MILKVINFIIQIILVWWEKASSFYFWGTKK